MHGLDSFFGDVLLSELSEVMLGPMRYALQIDGAWLTEDGTFSSSLLDAHEMETRPEARAVGETLATQHERPVKLCAILGKALPRARCVEELSHATGEWAEKGDV